MNGISGSLKEQKRDNVHIFMEKHIKDSSRWTRKLGKNWFKVSRVGVIYFKSPSKILSRYRVFNKYPLETIVFLITVTECHPSTRTLAHSKFKCKKKKKKAKFGDAFHVIHPISFHVQILHLRLNFEWQWNIAWFYSNFIYFFFWSGLMGRI